MVQAGQGGGQRRIARLQGGHRRPPRPRRHVLDRFHVIRWFAAGLTQVRRDVQRREPKGVKPAFDPEVFRARFALLRRGDTLTDTDRARLDKLFDAHPASKPAGRPCRSSTASTPPTTMTAPSTPSGGSATSTRPATCPSTTTPSTRSSPGPTRSSTGTVPAAPPTAESRAPTTCSKSCDAPPTASPNPRNFEARGILVT